MNNHIALHHIKRTIEALEVAGAVENARLVRLDMQQAGEDLRQLLMVRDNALDLLERTAA
jgi:hypothetical protein